MPIQYIKIGEIKNYRNYDVNMVVYLKIISPIKVIGSVKAFYHIELRMDKNVIKLNKMLDDNDYIVYPALLKAVKFSKFELIVQEVNILRQDGLVMTNLQACKVIGLVL